LTAVKTNINFNYICLLDQIIPLLSALLFSPSLLFSLFCSKASNNLAINSSKFKLKLAEALAVKNNLFV